MSIQILRLSATFNPSSICIEYREGKSSPQYKQFPIIFHSFSDPQSIFETLTEEYSKYFNKKSILPQKLLKFIQLAIQKVPSIDTSFSTSPKGKRNNSVVATNRIVDDMVPSDEFYSDDDQ